MNHLYNTLVFDLTVQTFTHCTDEKDVAVSSTLWWKQIERLLIPSKASLGSISGSVISLWS
jgi:hypothetical protein